MAGTPTMRHEIADYYYSDSAYTLMGAGFTALSEDVGAETEETHYINEKNASTEITGYKSSFPFTADKIDSETAIKDIYEIGALRKTGSNVKRKLCRVDLNSATDGVCEAREFDIAVEVSSFEGDAGKKMQVSGTFHQIGDVREGTFTLSSKTFTEKTS